MTTFTTQDRQDAERDWDAYEYMCPNCLTPWKCNGPHIVPLSDQELLKMAADKFHYTEYKLAIEFARAIERAHGIGE